MLVPHDAVGTRLHKAAEKEVPRRRKDDAREDGAARRDLGFLLVVVEDAHRLSRQQRVRLGKDGLLLGWVAEGAAVESHRGQKLPEARRREKAAPSDPIMLATLLLSTGFFSPPSALRHAQHCASPCRSVRSTNIASSLLTAETLLDDEVLPLLHFPWDEGLLLPGEARVLSVEKAEALAALNAIGEHGLLGALISTPANNALSTSTLLQVREIRKCDVGATVDVVAVGRVHLPDICHERGWFKAADVSLITDIEDDEDGAAIVESLVLEVQEAYKERERVEQLLAEVKRPGTDDSADGHKIEDRLSHGYGLQEEGAATTRFEGLLNLRSHEATATESLDRTLSEMAQALDGYELDLAPATTLGRLHSTWGVRHEREAEVQLFSFAACASLSVGMRALALALTSTEDRLKLARDRALKDTQRMQAQLAIASALAPAAE